jgi:hypothetical protein
MKSGARALERAFELARSGTVLCLSIFAMQDFTCRAGESSMTINAFSCFDKLKDIYDASYSRAWVVVNNFSIREERSLLSSNLDSVLLTASGANRMSNDVHLNVELVVFNAKGDIILAMVAQPMLSILSGGKTESIEGSIYVPPKSLPTATKSCLRIVGDF